MYDLTIPVYIFPKIHDKSFRKFGELRRAAAYPQAFTIRSHVAMIVSTLVGAGDLFNIYNSMLGVKKSGL